eukprot:258936_1
MAQSSIKRFYTGISSPMLFDSFSQTICCPLSTASSQAPALNFAENGILITIANSGGTLAHINCVPWSDYPHESECLWLGGYNPLTIIGLTHIPSSCDYSIYI